MKKELEEILVEGAAALGVELGPEAVGRFSVYLDELRAWNRKINLTSVDDEREIVIRHFLDSLTPCVFLGGVGRLLDIGAGGGFPALPIKIAMPEVGVTLVDSVGKKVHFMRHVIRRLALEGAEAIAARAEEAAFAGPRAGLYDAVISRAFSSIPDFIAVSLPLLRPGGLVVAMKGPKAAEELAAFDPAEAGVSAPEVFELCVPHSERATTIVIFSKL